MKHLLRPRICPTWRTISRVRLLDVLGSQPPVPNLEIVTIPGISAVSLRRFMNNPG